MSFNVTTSCRVTQTLVGLASVLNDTIYCWGMVLECPIIPVIWRYWSLTL